MGKFSGTRIERGFAEHVVAFVSKVLDQHGVRHKVAGSFRRGKAEVGDLDFILLDFPAKDLVPVFRAWTVKVGRAGPSVTSLVLDFEGCHVQVEFNNCPPNSLGAYLLHSTGSGAFNQALRSKAKKLGYKLNQYGLTPVESGTDLEMRAETEEDVFRALGFEVVVPENRSVDSIWEAFSVLKQHQKGK